ncbi:two component, sigma54 specific, transcriptional regulator, Fis family [Candidatus Koribacter versatilis Ellin345]|uniref:Two component, sigma54 specific, transcriptional regulator, Fis family n=1 Tax=Koribacter versatilis (strain Ellin345) TaxID=204669 RepID=Q1IMW7_KORVE|nr:sigma-54 dependent transcriptional regulator [Candidatus Koribacter versatilis]ABF41783.1 two component, sigma54 specific, transcriptional regulator, Fis family [Candidatus Koribacter versatilis Ellin345]
MAYSILICDDEALTLKTISRALEAEGYEIFLAQSGEQAVEIAQREHPDIALLDVVLPGIDGVEVLRQLKRLDSSIVVVMMSAYRVVERAVEALKLGAYDYLTKPFHVSDMVNTIGRASEVLALRVRVRDSVQDARGRYDFGRVVTRNAALAAMLEQAKKAAESDKTTILIQGESGTGKEVMAKTIHYYSPRAQQPLVSLNCAALPDTLLESELFGYEPGAYTDARRRKEGLLEKAHAGTLFLDEIGNMSFSVQAKLLRVLEEGNFMRLGGTRTIQVDVRIIAATNKVLKDAVSRGEFRDDLFYRLNVMPLFIPPLRERKEDTVPIALDMMKRFNKDLKKNFTGMTPEAAECLRAYTWPGNIRELRNVMERTMILATHGDISLDDLPHEIREFDAPPETSSGEVEISSLTTPFVTLEELEDRYILEVLTATGNNKTHAARILGIHPTSLARKLKRIPEEVAAEH